MDNQMTKPEERPGALPPEDWDEMPGYVPTREELVHLVGYWYAQVLDINWWYFTDRTIWGSDHRRRFYANARINELTAVLGDLAVEKAIAAVENDFRESHDARLWEVFKHGTSEQWEAVLDELGGPL